MPGRNGTGPTGQGAGTGWGLGGCRVGGGRGAGGSWGGFGRGRRGGGGGRGFGQRLRGGFGPIQELAPEHREDEIARLRRRLAELEGPTGSEGEP